MYKCKETFPRKGNILQYYKIVIQILYSVYGLIYTACAHMTPNAVNNMYSLYYTFNPT